MKERILNEEAITFIKKYAIPELGLKTPLSSNDMYAIVDYASNCEVELVDDGGNDRIDDYPGKERDTMGMHFIDIYSSFDFDNEDNLLRINSELQ